MTQNPARNLRTIAAAVCTVMLFGACKTVRTKDRWRKGDSRMSKMEKRWNKSQMEGMNVQSSYGAPGEEDFGYTQSEFNTATDIHADKGLFTDKSARTKTFRTKDFAGADEYKRNDYHFLKRQNFKAETSSDQSKRFATDTAPDERKKFFGGKKRARTKDYTDASKRARANNYRDTDAELKRLENRRPTIVRDDAQDAAASLMGIDDVRTMLNGSQ